MTNVLRWVVVAVLVGHGLIHLLGVAKGFGWAAVPQLKEPIGTGGGAGAGGSPVVLTSARSAGGAGFHSGLIL